MPLHVEIKANDKLLNTIHIGRSSGGTDPDDLNTYIAIEGERPAKWEDWYIDGIPYMHRYGDGAEVCVKKALEALGYHG
jgi:hypothetical protein